MRHINVNLIEKEKGYSRREIMPATTPEKYPYAWISLVTFLCILIFLFCYCLFSFRIFYFFCLKRFYQFFIYKCVMRQLRVYIIGRYISMESGIAYAAKLNKIFSILIFVRINNCLQQTCVSTIFIQVKYFFKQFEY